MLRKFAIVAFRAGEDIERGDLVQVDSGNGLIYKIKDRLSSEEFEEWLKANCPMVDGR